MRGVARNLLLGGIAAAALLGLSGLAEAGNVHTMTVRTPDGGTATIHYAGDVAPKVTFERGPWFARFGGGALAFPDFQRIQAQMDRQMQAMMREADAMAKGSPGAGPLFSADFGAPAKGASSYSFFSSTSSNGVCTRSVEVTDTGGGAAPRVERHSSGDCGKAARADKEPDQGI